jgi:hypothetical protein
MRKKVIGVIGGHICTEEVEQLAQNLGKKLVKVVDILVCGGLKGVMEAVCSGFKAGNGVTIGIIPSYVKEDANKYVDIVIPTGMGLARNVLVVKSADVVIALPGAAGTLSEVAYCLQLGVPVISLNPSHSARDESLDFIPGRSNSWDIPGVIKVKTVDEAIAKVKEILKP